MGRVMHRVTGLSPPLQLNSAHAGCGMERVTDARSAEAIVDANAKGGRLHLEMAALIA